MAKLIVNIEETLKRVYNTSLDEKVTLECDYGEYYHIKLGSARIGYLKMCIIRGEEIEEFIRINSTDDQFSSEHRICCFFPECYRGISGEKVALFYDDIRFVLWPLGVSSELVNKVVNSLVEILNAEKGIDNIVMLSSEECAEGFVVKTRGFDENIMVWKN